MKRFDIRSLTGARFQAALAAVSLVLILAPYNLVHTGALLARYINPDAFGYVAAAGIEIAIVGLSLRIGELRRSGRKAWGFYAVLIAVLAVSALANVAEGFATMYGELLTIANIARIDALQAVIGVAATGLLSVIVLALSEIIGGDVRKAAASAERQERKAAQDADTSGVVQLTDEQRAGLTTNIISLPPLTSEWTCAKCGKVYDKQQKLAAHQWRCNGAVAERSA